MRVEQRGYILALAVFIIAMGSILVTSLLQNAVGFDRLHKYRYKQQQARLLALSGIQIALAQLSNPVPFDEKKEQMFDQNLVPFLYVDQLQTFSVAQEGGVGEIGVLITSENGKINLNGLYDFEEKKFIVEKDNDKKKILSDIATGLQKHVSVENAQAQIEEQMRKRTTPFEDVSQLVVTQAVPQALGKLDLKDIFTLATPAVGPNPLFIADALAQVLELDKQPLAKKERLAIAKKVQELKGKVDWSKQWGELLKSLYKKEYAVLPEAIKKNLSEKIESTAFSVVSYGTVQDVTQKICVLVQKNESRDTQHVLYSIKRLYWL